MKKNQRNVGNGLDLLRSIKTNSIPLVFFDPQYRALLDKMAYGNEGKSKMIARSALPQMSTSVIFSFMTEIARVLVPSGHLAMWVDKFSLVQGTFLQGNLPPVDLITWEKSRIGMGYRTRRKCEYLVIMQKDPRRAKGIWTDHSIPDVWSVEREILERNKFPTLNLHVSNHPHSKPLGLQRRLIEAVTKKGSVVVDPSSGGYSVLRAARSCGRNFLGCDIIK